MLYAARLKPKWRRSLAQFEVIDGIVTRATPSLIWAVGKSIGNIAYWLEEKGISWGPYEGPASPSLKAQPDDSEIMKKVSP